MKTLLTPPPTPHVLMFHKINLEILGSERLSILDKVARGKKKVAEAGEIGTTWQLYPVEKGSEGENPIYVYCFSISSTFSRLWGRRKARDAAQGNQGAAAGGRWGTREPACHLTARKRDVQLGASVGGGERPGRRWHDRS